MNHESGFQTGEGQLKSLSERLTTAPLPYEQFLNLAIPVVEQIARLHTAGSSHGHLNTTSVMYDGVNRVELTAPLSAPVTFDEDLKALGRIFYNLLTGKSLSPSPHVSVFKKIYPVEARLTVEKLLGLHPSGQFTSAAELHASLILMKDVFDLSAKEPTAERRVGSARAYLFLSLIALILVLIWIAVSIFKRW